MDRNWLTAKKVPNEFTEKFPEINPVISQLLYNRSLDTQEKIDEFLYPDYSRDQNPPEKFAQLDRVLLRIDKALKKQEKVVIHGDYDADGVCSTCLIQEVLSKIGFKNLSIYIPNRETEGYGLNKKTVQKFIKDKVNLIITVDCGIANAEEIKLAKKNKIDTIVTDHHHEPLIFPKEAVAIIDPAVKSEPYPFKSLAGVGVAFKLAQALIKKYDLGAGYEKWLLDLVALSTITDCMPMVSENHTLVRYGLVVLNKTKRLGLQKLFKKMGNNFKKIDEEIVGFRIGPRLNAAGRMDHANTAYQLLVTKDEAEAEKLVSQLNEANIARQKATEKIVAEVKKQLKGQEKNNVLFAFAPSWPIGIIGLVAGKIADEYNKPAFVLTKNHGEIVGSGRSIAQLNLIETVQQCAEFLTRYGGHAQACGFTVKSKEDLKNFQQKFMNLANEKLDGQDLRKVLSIEAEIKLCDINWGLISELEKFAPHGEENRRPLFLMRNLSVTDWRLVGKENKHLRLTVCCENKHHKKSIGFNLGKWSPRIQNNTKVDLVCELNVNEWNGNKEIQIKIIDLKLCTA